MKLQMILNLENVYQSPSFQFEIIEEKMLNKLFLTFLRKAQIKETNASAEVRRWLRIQEPN